MMWCTACTIVHGNKKETFPHDFGHFWVVVCDGIPDRFDQVQTLTIFFFLFQLRYG